MYKKMLMGVVGCGVIGNSLANLLEDLGHEVKRYDPAKNLTDNISKCDIVFICVPTKADMKFEDIRTAVAYVNLKNKKGIGNFPKIDLKNGLTSRYKELLLIPKI